METISEANKNMNHIASEKKSVLKNTQTGGWVELGRDKC